MKLSIKNGLIVNPATELTAVGTVFVEDGNIACIKTDKEVFGQEPVWQGDFKEIDATGKLVTPGLIDLHVHFREPGFEYKEDISSGCAAAARGGFTAVCPMPNTEPVIDNAESVKYVQGKASRACGVRVHTVGAVTESQRGGCLSDIEGMVKAGAKAISEDGKSVMDADLMRAAMEKAAALGIPIFDHAEDANMPGRMIAEELIVARDIMLAKETGCKLHLCHISTKASLDIIRRAKSEGTQVTAETAPHYFTLTKSDVQGDGNKKMNPPLRGKSHIAAIKKALADGTLDAIATDHAPHSPEEKEVPYDKALNGIIGLETSFPVSYTNLVQNGNLALSKLIWLMSTRPAEILGVAGGDLSVGAPADIAVFDMEKPYQIQSGDFVSKSRNCPFVGSIVYGKTLYTIVGGSVVYEG